MLSFRTVTIIVDIGGNFDPNSSKVLRYLGGEVHIVKWRWNVELYTLEALTVYDLVPYKRDDSIKMFRFFYFDNNVSPHHIPSELELM